MLRRLTLSFLVSGLLYLATTVNAEVGSQKNFVEWESMNSLPNYSFTRDIVNLCLSTNPIWVDFCNGLFQGYNDYLVVKNLACIPFSVSPRELVDIFISPEIVIHSGYIDDWPAIETAKEIFIKHFPCSWIFCVSDRWIATVGSSRHYWKCVIVMRSWEYTPDAHQQKNDRSLYSYTIAAII